MYCTECGANNADSSRFCMRCGARLIRVEPPEPSGPQPGTEPTEIDAYEPAADIPTVVQPAQEPSPPPIKPASRPFPPFRPVQASEAEQVTEWARPAESGWVEERSAAPPYEAPTQLARVRRRRFPRVLLTCGLVAVIVVLVLVAAVVAAWFWLGLHRTNQTVSIIPDDAPMVVSFSPDPRQALHYRDVQSLEALVPLFAAVPGLLELADEEQAQVLTDFSVDLQADILPWIGREASIAVLDLEDAAFRGAPPILVSLATRNQTRSDAFLAKLQDELEDEGFTFEEETYRGTRVVYQVPDREGSFAPAYATTSHLVLLGTDRDTVHTAIDLAQGKSKRVLANEEAYQAVLKELPANRVGYAYVDGRTFSNQLAAEGDQTEGLQAVEGLGAAFSLSSRGLVVDYVLRYDPDKMSRSHEEAMVRLPTEQVTARFLPEGTVAYWSEQGAKTSWEGLMYILHAIEELEDPLWEVDSTLREVEREAHFSLENDLLSQMTGEYALALVPDRSGFPGADDVALGLVLMAEVRRPSTTRSTLEDLTQALATTGIVSSPPVKEGDVTYVNTGAGWSLAYGFVDDYLVIGSSPTAVEAALEGKGDPLADASLYRDVLRRLPSQARGYLLADADSIIDAILKAGSADDRDLYERELEPYLDSLQAVGFSLGSMDEDGLVQGSLVVLTK